MKKCLTFLLLLTALAVAGQTRSRQVVRTTATTVDSVSVRVKNYLDSLAACKERIDSLPSVDVDDDVNYSRLFMPMTFYHNIARHQFSITPSSGSQKDLETDRALLDVYLRRPDLVMGTQSQLDIIGPTLTPQTGKISSQTHIVEKVAPTVVEPDNVNVNVDVKRPNFWKFSGDAGLQAFQNYISGNWYQGGESNYSFLSWINLHANYNNKQKVKWDNTLEIKLGMLSSRSDTLHSMKTNTVEPRTAGHQTMVLYAEGGGADTAHEDLPQQRPEGVFRLHFTAEGERLYRYGLQPQLAEEQADGKDSPGTAVVRL